MTLARTWCRCFATPQGALGAALFTVARPLDTSARCPLDSTWAFQLVTLMGVFTRRQSGQTQSMAPLSPCLGDLALSADVCFLKYRFEYFACCLRSLFIQARRKSGPCQSILARDRSLILFWTLFTMKLPSKQNTGSPGL